MEQTVKPFCCPVCSGTGRTTDQHSYTGTGTSAAPSWTVCPACQGSCIVWGPPTVMEPVSDVMSFIQQVADKLPTVELPDIPEEDISFEYFRPPGTDLRSADTAVRATHIPTGVSVTVWHMNSRELNRKRAREALQRSVAGTKELTQYRLVPKGYRDDQG